MLISRVAKDDKPAVKCLTNKIRVLLVVILTTLSLVATAQERVALVIGNSNYITSPLANTLNDAQDIAETLEGLDFAVTTVIDGNRTEMIKAIRAFGKSLDKKTIALFYYAGHGVQYNGENYLIPVGALPEITERSYLEDEAVTLSRVTRVISESGSKLNFVFLDACRNNPIPADSRGIQTGLIQTQSAVGSLIAFSTAPGRVAEDGAQEEGSNSPYTKNLLELIVKPNVPVEKMLKDLKAAVSLATNERQSPWYESNIEGDFCFNVVKDGCAVTYNNPFLKGLENIKEIYHDNGDRFIGQVFNGSPTGKGIMEYTNGDYFEGVWENGKRHGSGLYIFTSGARFQGEWRFGDSYEDGLYVFSDGTITDATFNPDVKGSSKLIFPNGDSFIGDWLNGSPFGQGIYYFNNGVQFEGVLEGLKSNEEGVYKYLNGGESHGYFSTNLLVGNGTMTFPFATYEGSWMNGEFNGYGKVMMSGGETYEGEWKDGLMHGMGVFRSSKRTWNSLFKEMFDQGFMEESEPHAQRDDLLLPSGAIPQVFFCINAPILNSLALIFTNWDDDDYEYLEPMFNLLHFEQCLNHLKHYFQFADGVFTNLVFIDSYEGEWFQGKMNGKGKLVFGDSPLEMEGSTYIGEFDKGILTSGQILSDDGLIVYNGSISNFRPNGRGVAEDNGVTYNGEWKDGSRSGNGTITTADGSRYEGEWKDDMFNGQGVYTYSNGDRYEGQWKDNKYNGQGVRTFADGGRFEGEWKDGKRNGQGVMTYADGSQEQQVWENGELISSEPL